MAGKKSAPWEFDVPDIDEDEDSYIVNSGVECPTCGACPGEECEGPNGGLVPPHSTRRRAAGF